MKYCPALLLAFFLLSCTAAAQSPESPCTLQARVSIGICIDLFCIPAYGYAEGGTPPYHYQWFNGDTKTETYLNYGADPTGLDTCLTLTVTDAAGCIAMASIRYTYGPLPQFQVDSTFLSNDTLTIGPGGGNFDVGVNDHVFAQNYQVVQPPQHGDVALNADGTGTYTPFPGWCGPDYFRYTATDTGGCTYGRMTTVRIESSPCAGILPGQSDCNHSCTGTATFYQNGVLTPPLNYLWSNGSTASQAEQLCEGPVSVTVSDASGAAQVYTASVAAGEVLASVTGPGTVCNGTVVTLAADITATSGPGYHFYWSGPGIYSGLQFENPVQAYCSSQTDSAVYLLNVRSADGCLLSVPHTIEINPAVSINLSVQLPPCAGDSLEIRPRILKPGTPPYTYVWSGPNGVQSNWPELIWPGMTPAYNGLYALTVTDVNGCTAKSSYPVMVPDTCAYRVVISNKGATYCAQSEIRLQFGMAPTWLPPEQVEWSGPNGFNANTLSTLLTDVQPNMSGWYYLAAHLGNTVLLDSIYIAVAPDILSATLVSLTPPGDCIAPYDGVLTLQMNVAPPYEVRYSDIGSYQTVQSNPFTRNTVRSGYLEVTVRKNGCIALEILTVPTPAPPQVAIQAETCTGNDAAITLSSAHPLTVSWKLPDGSNLNNQQNLSGLMPGTYFLYAKDQTTNCIFNDTLELSPYLDIQVSVVDTPTCTSAGGSLLAAVAGNVTPPVEYDWNTGFSGNPVGGLAPGGYSLTVTDGAGCSRHRNVVLAPEEACIAQVSGHVYANTACICTADSNTVVFPFAKICATNGNQTTCAFTENTGAYTLALTEPGNYTISATTYLPAAQGVCTEWPYTVGQDITKDTAGVDFYFCGLPASDLETSVFCGPARPGFPYTSSVQVRNNGFWSADTSLLTVSLSPLVNSPVFSPQPDFYDPATHLVRWKIAKLALYQQFKIQIDGTVAAGLGDTLAIAAGVESLYTPDPYAGNNTSFCSVIVTGSYDPNDKTVNPLGVGASGNIAPEDSVLTYTIRFQNTGTDVAFTVVVRDTLDPAVFDLNSIRPLLSSHPFHLRVESGNILVFEFDPIDLPDSNRTVEGSKGFVLFSIRLRKNLPEGTRIANTAAIYFDYNSPVITNTVQNTIVQVVGPESLAPEIILAPNPAAGRTLLSIGDTQEVQWMDIALIRVDGTLLRRLYSSHEVSPGLSVPIDIHALSPGLYVISVRSNLGQVCKKLLVLSE